MSKQAFGSCTSLVSTHGYDGMPSSQTLLPYIPHVMSSRYGTGLTTVREVAATGRLCLMRLDLQGAKVRQCVCMG